MRAWFTAAAAFALACLAQTAAAAEATSPANAGSADAGAAKAGTCVACHGPAGVANINPEWPVIAGQSAHYVAEQVKLVRDGARPVPLMQPIVKGLSDQDILDIAAYFSRQTPSGLEADPSYWKAGEQLYRGGDASRGIPACIACHGPVGRGVPAAGFPALRAQHAVYTQKQLNDYAADTRYTKDEKGQRRASANAAMMVTIASRLTAEDRRNLASYVQGMR